MDIRIAFPTDEHHPYQDDKAIALALKIVNEFDPTEIVVGSDGMDFYSISKFSKDPDRMKGGSLQDEIDSWVRTQRMWIDAAPNARRHYIPGNHEDRLKKYIWEHPELHGLDALQLPSLLEFDQLALSEIEDEVEFGDKLLVTHGSVVRKYGAYTAKGELENQFYSISTMTGHTHRGGMTMATGRKGMVQGIECFCLCDLEPDYVKSPNWQQGVVLATVSDFGVHFEPVPFFRANGKIFAQWRGQEYS